MSLANAFFGLVDRKYRRYCLKRKIVTEGGVSRLRVRARETFRLRPAAEGFLRKLAKVLPFNSRCMQQKRIWIILHFKFLIGGLHEFSLRMGASLIRVISN